LRGYCEIIINIPLNDEIDIIKKRKSKLRKLEALRTKPLECHSERLNAQAICIQVVSHVREGADKNSHNDQL
jgi:hypothetical protein